MQIEIVKYIRLLCIASLVVFFDQLTKYIVFLNLPLYDYITVIPGFFHLTHIQNPGGAFGFLANQSSTLRSIMFIIVSIMATGLILYLYHITPKTFTFLSFGLALIFGGAIGNLIDRLRLGQVIDFLDFFIGNIHWPAFNVADSAVSVGITIFAYHVLLNKMPDESKSKDLIHFPEQ